eukprot:TRINITY_DN22713_c0_g1_i1.p1 TRINITY_DN22713_c0_g1~~TRINITY_DN22713_c0_g1_i1.p1  ORF type:complete len:373 (+),score=64.06 TRINITY_DN22713_c0_g1_i1:209-1327(+)
MVESGDDVVRGPQMGSIRPGMHGRKVRLENLAPLARLPEPTRDGLSAANIFVKLSDGGGKLAIGECAEMGMEKMVGASQWEVLVRQGGINRAQFVRLYDRYQFGPALVAVAAEFNQDSGACGPNVHCLGLGQVAKAWPTLQPGSIQSPEWQRFGRMGTSKKEGWRNLQAIVDAFALKFKETRAEDAAKKAVHDAEVAAARDAKAAELAQESTATRAEAAQEAKAAADLKAAQEPEVAERDVAMAAAAKEQQREEGESAEEEDANCGWHQTGGCHWRGRREPEQDLGCKQTVPAGASGYCHCDGKIVARAGCNHGPFQCAEHCEAYQHAKQARHQEQERDRMWNREQEQRGAGGRAYGRRWMPGFEGHRSTFW